MLSPSTMGLLLGAVALFAYLLYRSTIPTPIPGIPYSPSAIRPFGDVSAALKYQAETELMTSFFTEKCYELQSPIVQIFMEPFKKPWVIIADCVTAEDILTRRTKEFDVSSWFTGVFEAIVPESHLHLPTNDHWRKRRRAINDVMSGNFLHTVSGPRAYTACLEMIELWKEKLRLGGKRPFSVAMDIEHMLLDNIWAVAFGSSIGSTNAQKDLLTSLTSLSDDKTTTKSAVASFPEAPRPPAYDTIVAISDSHEIPIRSPVGPLHHKLALMLYPRFRKAAKEREVMIAERLDVAMKHALSDEPEDIACAADSLLRRERMLAEKEGRSPQYDHPTIRDDLYIFLQAGNDTSATTLQWAVKYLTGNQVAQGKLREALRREYGSDGLPSSLEITRAHIPYLEATVEEVFRLSAVVGVVARQTQMDCTVLGHVVPKGTNVILTNCGPGYRSPPIVDPNMHARPENQFRGNWDPESLAKFQPERWLYTDDAGQTQFLHRAGPTHSMGTGMRHCWGKPLAMLSLRLFLTMILLSFDLQPLPDDLEEFDAIQVMTHRPKTVYLNLRPL